MALRQLLALPPPLRASIINPARSFSVIHRPSPSYDGHVPLNLIEKGALAAGSAVLSLLNPYRAGMFSEGNHGSVSTNSPSRPDCCAG